MVLSWVTLAWAGSVDLARAERAIAEGRPEQAYRFARTAVEEGGSPDEWLVYFRGCEMSGLHDACRAETALIDDAPDFLGPARTWFDLEIGRLTERDIDPPPPEFKEFRLGSWKGELVVASMREELRDLFERSPDDAAVRSLELIEEHPEHPELLTPLFSSTLPPRSSIGKTRKKVLKIGSKRLDDLDVAGLYRWYELFVASGDEDAIADLAGRLEAKGERAPLKRLPMTRGEVITTAEDVFNGNAEVPGEVLAEHEAVAVRVAALYSDAARYEEAATFLEGVRAERDTASLAVAHADVLLNAGDLGGARDVVKGALQAVSEPWETDLAITGRLARREALAKVYAVRGRVHLEATDHTEAIVDLMVANQLSMDTIEAGALEHAMGKGRYGLDEIKAGLETRRDGAADVALTKAREALEAGDHDAAVDFAGKAIAVLCIPAHRNGRLTAKIAFTPEMASAFALRGLAESKRGDSQAALQDISTAIALLPWDSPSDWWSLKADMLMGNTEAEFFARAMSVSTSEEESAFPKWYGSADTGAAAGAAMVAAWMLGSEDEKDSGGRLKVARGRVVPFRAPRSGGGGGGRRPSLNRAFPAFRVETPEGLLTHQPGRIEVVTFFRSDSPSSLRAMDELTDLARRLRKGRAINVVLVGIGMDPNEEDFNRLRSRSERWGSVGWAPNVGASMGVHAVPTTWIVDDEGVARFQHVGYLGPGEYEAEVRMVAGR